LVEVEVLGDSIRLDTWLWVAPEFESRKLVKPERVVVFIVVWVDGSIEVVEVEGVGVVVVVEEVEVE
jgi:hypothetical protein